ncbi:MAG: GNAT family N-acetyltransferase [Bryobacterales bacterium]|nr:GNAT family N-acetyltransferase [Bryobacterales bacterium]
MRVMCARRDNFTFLARIEGHPVAAASLAIHERVALLAGASTIPEWRRRGAQLALLEARLSHARLSGCDVAMIAAEPGSATQRNVERLGFHLAYTRIKWGRELN